MPKSNTIVALLLIFLSCGLASAETAVYWISGPVPQGQTVLLTGFFPKPETISIRVWSIGPQSDWRSAPADAIQTTVLNANQTSVAFAIPNNGASIFAFRLDQQGEQPIWGRVNLPEIWWSVNDPSQDDIESGEQITPNSAVAGQAIRVLGRSLAVQGKVVILELVSKTGEATRLETAVANPYSVLARIPVGVKEGQYRLRPVAIPNAPASRGIDIEFTIRARRLSQWPKVEVDGADGNGRVDNSVVFQTALNKAASLGGATIRIPKGVFLLQNPLTIPPHVRLEGASTESSIIAFPQTDTPPDAWVSGTANFSLQSLSIYCGNHKQIVASDLSGDPLKSGHIRIQGVRIVGNALLSPVTFPAIGSRSQSMAQQMGTTYEALHLSGPDILVENSYVFGSSRSIVLFQANGAILRGNTFRNGIWGWYNLDCSQNVINEHNAFEGGDLLASGGSYSMFGQPKRSANIYTESNSYSDIIGNDAEAFTTDAPGSAYSGAVDADGTVLRLRGQPTWGQTDWTGAAAIIVSGRGTGQWRRLKKWANTNVELEEAFAIKPDTSSVIAIIGCGYHYVFYRNHFKDAGVAIQFFGASIEHIAAENDATRAGGFSVISLNYHGIQPSLNIQLIGNELRPGLNYRRIYEPTATPLSVIFANAKKQGLIYGLVIRDSKLAEDSLIELRNASQIKAVLLERNQTPNPKTGIQLTNCDRKEVLILPAR